MIYVHKLESRQKRGHTREHDAGDEVGRIVPDEFASLELELSLRWNKEHAPLMEKLFKAVLEIQKVADFSEVVDDTPG